MSLYIKVCFILLLLSSHLLFAHQRSESYSSWSIIHGDNDTTVTTIFTIKFSVLARMNWEKGEWEKQITDYVIKSIKTIPECHITEGPDVFSSQQLSSLKISWKQLCAKGQVNIVNGAFFDKDPMHSHIARFEVDSLPYPEKLFTNESRLWVEDQTLVPGKDKLKGSSIKDYVALGIQHITSGFDHIAFLLGLLLLNPRIKQLFISITGFTIGHSLTLFLGVLGYVKPATGFVEALIGYSIALVALEFLARKTNRYFYYSKFLFFIWVFFIFIAYLIDLRIALLGLIGTAIFSVSYFWLAGRTSSKNFSFLLTCLFGLVHGFGFGGYLSEIGLPSDRLLPALLGFNIGVELGQICIVILFILLIRSLGMFKFSKKFLIEPLIASSLISLGTYWFLVRIF